MATYNTPSARYVPLELIKLIKTRAAIGLKEARLEIHYDDPMNPALPQGVPPGTHCSAHRSLKTNMIIWEAKWP
ncbi:hypothetical protein [Klebsiella phage pKP-BM327-1.2]|nr:hypothetical protein [Klebsiella phage pKP-BM327-1.2]